MSGLFEFVKLSLRMIVVAATSVVILMYMWPEFTNSIWSDPGAILVAFAEKRRGIADGVGALVVQPPDL